MPSVEPKPGNVGAANERLALLLVEDDDVDRMRVHRAVARRQEAFEMVDAGSLSEARAWLAKRAFDCLVVDYNLPDGDALELLEHLATSRLSVPVVVLTGFADDELALRALQHGAEDYLAKDNFHVESFTRAVHYAVQRHRLRRDLEHTNARLQHELEVGAGIQTSILPRSPEVPGFEIAARMLPATEVGGDYYDVIPIEDGGCWIGIGDVAGHGMSAAVVMLMVQSALAALLRRDLAASPAQIIAILNEVLYDNVRVRMQQSEHVTLSLLRLSSRGEVCFAGAHEDMLVYRAKTRTIERFETTGTWLAARRGIQDVTYDQQLQLEPGDAMLLYSDGLIEATSSTGERFGLERLCRLLEAHGSLAATQIHEHIAKDLEGFVASHDDDVTLLVIRAV